MTLTGGECICDEGDVTGEVKVCWGSSTGGGGVRLVGVTSRDAAVCAGDTEFDFRFRFDDDEDAAVVVREPVGVEALLLLVLLLEGPLVRFLLLRPTGLRFSFF